MKYCFRRIVWLLHRSYLQQPDYSTKTIFHERNDLFLFILSVMHGGYNMNIRCNEKFMFYEDRSIDFSVCSEDTRDI